jgi:hypothetical protein
VLPSSPAPGGSGAVFPITGGTLDAATLAGTISHSGSLTVTKAGVSPAVLRNPELVTDGAALLSVESQSLGRQTAADVDLSGVQRDVDLTETGGSVRLSGATVRLQLAATTLVGSVFGVTLPGGTPLGTLALAFEVS